MKYLKSLILFLVVALGSSSCSLFTPSHTRCSAYSYNEPDNSDLMEEGNQVNPKDLQEPTLVY